MYHWSKGLYQIAAVPFLFYWLLSWHVQLHLVSYSHQVINDNSTSRKSLNKHLTSGLFWGWVCPYTECSSFCIHLAMSVCVCVCPSVFTFAAALAYVRVCMRASTCICVRACICVRLHTKRNVQMRSVANGSLHLNASFWVACPHWMQFCICVTFTTVLAYVCICVCAAVVNLFTQSRTGCPDPFQFHPPLWELLYGTGRCPTFGVWYTPYTPIKCL